MNRSMNLDPHFLDLGTSWRWVVSFTPDSFTPGESAPSNHWIGGWVNLRVGLDDLEKRIFMTLLGLELRPLSRPARSQSLYRLRYPGSLPNKIWICCIIIWITLKQNKNSLHVSIRLVDNTKTTHCHR
jgi:hypothetical protein